MADIRVRATSAALASSPDRRLGPGGRPCASEFWETTPTSADERQPELRTASLTDIAARGIPRPDMVTAVIGHEVKPDAGPRYEQWLARIIPVAARFPGHRGVNVIRPAAGTHSYTVTIHFDTLDHAQDWFRSDARRQPPSFWRDTGISLGWDSSPFQVRFYGPEPEVPKGSSGASSHVELAKKSLKGLGKRRLRRLGRNRLGEAACEAPSRCRRSLGH